jgi:predicted alpha/beta superfamily hydrolase
MNQILPVFYTTFFGILLFLDGPHFVTPAFGQIPTVTVGKIHRIENFESRYVQSRNVDIWLPDSYDGKSKFAVLYMHDGQMLFDSTLTWNKQSWDVEIAATKVMGSKRVKPFIVVGVWNAGSHRHSDYYPQKAYEMLSDVDMKTINEASRPNGVPVFSHPVQSDNYLKFLVTELKPYIDQNFSVYADQKNTFIAGSSMGGLISMYAVCEYPTVFGGAACISTHWPGVFAMENNPVPATFYRYLEENLPDPKTVKFYFDYGTETLDAVYPPLQANVDKIMKKRGFNKKSWVTKAFPGEEHSENSWRKRLDVPLQFLFAK